MAIENLLTSALAAGYKINKSVNKTTTHDEYDRPIRDEKGRYIEKRYRSSSPSIPGSYISGFMNKR